MKKLNLNNSQLGYYIAGLVEGDGNIWTQKTIRTAKGRINNPHIAFTFHKKDKPLYACIKEVLKGGRVFEPKLNNVCRYAISEKNKLIAGIYLINGKFRTPKIKYLHRAIDYINTVHNLNIEKLPLDNSSLESNAWLAGMTDSDGNFHISLEGTYGLTNSMARGRVKCTFSIKQRVIDEPTGGDCVPFMSEIADLFKCKINYKGVNALTFLAQADNKHDLTKSYFDKFPLMSSKYLDYLCFLKGQNYLGKRLTDEEVMEVRTLKNSMNNKRTYFNWDHLNNFYR
jgi:hypothetical protein